MAEKKTQFPDVHEIVGDYGPWQRPTCVLLILICVISQWQNLNITFLAPKTPFSCISSSFENETSGEQQNFSTISDESIFSRNDTYITDQCKMVDNWNLITPCSQWDFNLTFRTIVSEWTLVCDREWLISFSKSIYMIGYMTSILVMGTLSDWFGRYPIITLSYTIMTVSAMLLPVSTSYTMFAVLRFFLGFGRTGVTTTGYVLLMEIVSPKWRSDLGFGLQIGWSVGYIILPGIAWLINDWVYLQLALSVPTLFFIGIYWIVPESPRWLLTQKKWEKFDKLLEKATTKNNFNMDDTVKCTLDNYRKQSQEDSTVTKKSILDVIRSRRLRFQLLPLFFIWIVNSFVYYGLSFNTNDLAGNPYLNFFLSGLVEFPAIVVFIYALRKVGRKWILLVGLILVGACCALIIIVPTRMMWLSVTFAMLAKLSITGTYQVIYLCTTEIFPTVVRNAMLGYCSMFARLGPILAPFVSDLGRTTHPAVPNLLYASVAIIAGLLVLTLPETRNQRIPDELQNGKEDLITSTMNLELKSATSND